MRTPAGKECRYFYGDYYRGRSQEECRLLQPAGLRWKPELCKTCPVPGILRANACTHLILEPQFERPFPFLQQRVKVKAFCTKTTRAGFDPHIGCGECHPLPPIFNGDRS
ncbi:MAG: hypothetical protein MUE67_04890 [Anaerolineales bacterium]|jgi:hypothetical protein|nr:hypothetical protein [Anaerolineales bacterium]